MDDLTFFKDNSHEKTCAQTASLLEGETYSQRKIETLT